MTDRQTPAQRNRRMVLLTDGFSDPITAKTACCLLRYCPHEVLAVLDQSSAGKTAGEVFGVGGEIPLVAHLSDIPEAETLCIGIAPPGGKIPAAWRPVVLQAIARGMTLLSGLHDFLTRDPEFQQAAEQSGAALIDVRRNNEHDVAHREGIRDDCLRLLTVGNDCSIGKMVTSLELARALDQRTRSTKFVATGQTGILVEGDGCPIDTVVADFLSGAVEKLILANQTHDILMFEGQGSLTHPRYSAVTLGLLHGCMPHGMILCYEVGRTHVNGLPQIPLKDLSELRQLYETVASAMFPSRVIGVAMNSRYVNEEEAEHERQRIRNELGLPVCDVIRHGPEELVEAVETLYHEVIPQQVQ